MIVYAELVPAEHWDLPAWVDPDRLQQSTDEMVAEHQKFAGTLTYHQMCRWYSGFFYKHPALAEMDYYWRVEPDVK